MPAFNSKFNDPHAEIVCGCPILPLKTSVAGPAPIQKSNDPDFVDEAIELFRANVLFSTFDIKTPADRTLTFCILYISLCLREMEKCKTADEAQRRFYILSPRQIPLPGSSGYSLSKIFPAPQTKEEADKYMRYMGQIRSEIEKRIVPIVFKDGDWSRKWWMTFVNKNFMNLTLNLL